MNSPARLAVIAFALASTGGCARPPGASEPGPPEWYGSLGRHVAPPAVAQPGSHRVLLLWHEVDTERLTPELRTAVLYSDASFGQPLRLVDARTEASTDPLMEWGMSDWPAQWQLADHQVEALEIAGALRVATESALSEHGWTTQLSPWARTTWTATARRRGDRVYLTVRRAHAPPLECTLPAGGNVMVELTDTSSVLVRLIE